MTDERAIAEAASPIRYEFLDLLKRYHGTANARFIAHFNPERIKEMFKREDAANALLEDALKYIFMLKGTRLGFGIAKRIRAHLTSTATTEQTKDESIATGEQDDN